MPYWESMKWPMAMMRPFVSFSRIVRNITGWRRGGNRICVVAGALDKIVSVNIARNMADSIGAAVVEQASNKKVDYQPSVEKQAGTGVDFLVVKDGPHHF